MPYPILLAASDHGRWHPGIGDPSVYGWITVGAYLIACALCFLAWRRTQHLGLTRGRWRLRLFWIVLSIAMLLLAINKQLDLQSLITQVGKDLAQEQGWYKQRRAVQKQFVLAVAVTGVLSVIVTALMLWGHWRRAAIALVGITVTICFVIIRAASFHRFDQLITQKIAGIHLNVLLELTGITLVSLGALLNLRKPRDSSSPA